MSKRIDPAHPLWRESDTRVIFQTIVAERGEVVLSNAAVELQEELQPEAAMFKNFKSMTGIV